MRQEIQSELAQAFDHDLLDAISKFSCTKVTYSGKYNPATEQYENQQQHTYTGRAILGNYLKDLVKPDQYQANDVKALVLQNELSSPPHINDEWVFEHQTYKVMNISQDSSAAIWTCQLRGI